METTLTISISLSIKKLSVVDFFSCENQLPTPSNFPIGSFSLFRMLTLQDEFVKYYVLLYLAWYQNWVC